MAAAHPGPRLGRRAGEASGGARIQHQFGLGRDIADQVADAPQPHRPIIGAKACRDRGGGLAGCGWALLAHPFRQSAIQHGRVVMAVQAHEPPAARGRGQALLVVEHHTAGIADAHTAEEFRETAGGGDHVRQLGVLIGDLIDVKIPRARDMGGQELRLSVAVLIRQVFGGVEDDQVGLAEFPGKPVGGYQRPHAFPLGRSAEPECGF